MAANRVGKTVAGGYEVSVHATGEYPDWWEGRVFDKPVKMIVSGDTSVTTRDILQSQLLGDYYNLGNGLIPRKNIVSHVSKPGVPNGIDTVSIAHKSGRNSLIAFKSYEQGRKIFQGTEQDVIWFDEEPPADVYNEALIRTATTNGITMVTFTPIEGMSEVVMSFMPSNFQVGV